MDLKEKLEPVLESWEITLLPKSYDIIGDIAVIRIPERIANRAEEIAKAIVQINKHVNAVLQQVSPVSGEHRLRELKWITGEKKTETVHKESGCVFRVDVEKCYFSPRLSYERMRVARQVKPGEVVVNMFAGVGCFSIIIAKHAKAKKVYSIDINPYAVKCMVENARLNRVEDIVETIEGDAKTTIESRLRGVADRVLMPLPEKAYEYLEYAVMALKTGEGTIHYYDFVHAGKGENPLEKVAAKVSERLNALNATFEISFGRIVRTVGPRWHQAVLDISIHKQ